MTDEAGSSSLIMGEGQTAQVEGIVDAPDAADVIAKAIAAGQAAAAKARRPDEDEPLTPEQAAAPAESKAAPEADPDDEVLQWVATRKAKREAVRTAEVREREAAQRLAAIEAREKEIAAKAAEAEARERRLIDTLRSDPLKAREYGVDLEDYILKAAESKTPEGKISQFEQTIRQLQERLEGYEAQRKQAEEQRQKDEYAARIVQQEREFLSVIKPEEHPILSRLVKRDPQETLERAHRMSRNLQQHLGRLPSFDELARGLEAYEQHLYSEDAGESPASKAPPPARAPNRSASRISPRAAATAGGAPPKDIRDMDDAERVRFAIANAERVHQEQLKRANDDY